MIIDELGIVEDSFDLIKINLSGSYYSFLKLKGNFEFDKDLILLTTKIENQIIALINLVKPTID